MFALVAFALLVGVRVFAKERAYAEACVITYLLVALSVLLKAADLAVPWVTTVVCFPDSALPPFNSTLVAHNCDRPCMLGDIYATYGLYCIGKAIVGVADLVMSTGFLLRKPRDWYRGLGMGSVGGSSTARLRPIPRKGGTKLRGAMSLFSRQSRKGASRPSASQSPSATTRARGAC